MRKYNFLRVVLRIVLVMLPIPYMTLIWLQSAHFNPGVIEELSYTINPTILLMIGICFELLHIFEFGLLYLFLLLAFLTFGKLSKGKEWTAVLVSLLYSFVDEIHQIYVPFRSFSLDDLLKDAIGIFVVMWLIRNRFYRKNSRIGSLLRRIPFHADSKNHLSS